MEAMLFDLSIIIIAATVLAITAKFLKQPAILGYIIGGIVIGPFGLKLISNSDEVSTIAELGIALLLFVVGLELNVGRLKKVGGKATLIGVAEILIMVGIGFVVAQLLGLSEMAGIYLGLVLAFSSTLVVVKLLSDGGALDTLHGRLMLGILLIQDVAVIIVLSILINSEFSITNIGLTLLYGISLLGIAMLSARYVLPLFFKKIAESSELLLLFSLAWCLLFAGASSILGFSIVIGSFIAGLSLASFPYNFEIIGRVKPLRDFFVTIFFVTIGIQIIPIFSRDLIIPIVVLILIAILVKPVVIALLMSLSRYSRRTSFSTSLGLGQISEFSIILAMQGVLLNHIDKSLLSIIIVATAITMLISTYFSKYNKELFDFVGTKLLFFNKHRHKELENLPKTEKKNHFVLFGADRTGRKILDSLSEMGYTTIVVDYNPELVHTLIKKNKHCIYGDAEDIEILERVNLKDAYAVVSTIPENDLNISLLKRLNRQKNPPLFFSVADTVFGALKLYEKGADYVLLPQFLAGEKLSDIIEHFNKREIIDILRLKQFSKLEKARERELLERYAPTLLKYRRTLSKNEKKK